ncbi:disease resistance protein RGA5-like [Triticum urartu]|uniref:Disease resistance protein RPM1 n=2 Tax=Triticum urartu TaxID=4572 RepID=A0A8R7QE47_TRIUA|nr:disease resistance protein RGA5-like [Triticum urartu]XP_048531052.1 disease resistance protein RGA5-like [Triticum urartu]
MAELATSVAAGVICSLLEKLGSLAAAEYAMFSSDRRQVELLVDELSSMKAVLEKLAYMENLDPLTRQWRDQVRELTYDTEDSIVSSMLQDRQDGAKDWFIWKIFPFFKDLREGYSLSKQINQIKAAVIELSARRERLRVDEVISTSSHVSIDPRLHVLYKDAAGLVGIDGQKDKLIGMLKDGDQHLKVVSVVGFGGLGKTTLANLVYDASPTLQHHEHRFDCRAFLSVSQRPDINGVFCILLRMFGGSITPSDNINVQLLVSMLNKHLQHKRYFIVIDDLWNESDWHTIRCAFPDNNSGSRLIVTTRIDSVALDCCSNRREYVYPMKPLEEEYSRRLFLTRIFGSEDACPEYLKEASAEILRKCGGLPLAINVVSGFLASKKTPERKEHWDRVQSSLGTIDREFEPMKQMSQILNLSYMHLPHHLRACFLHLGIYPEDREIMTDDLVKQWVAEDFVPCSPHRRDREDVAKDYFNELVNRSILQPVDIDYKDEVLSCRLHDMMLEFILNKSADENFITVMDRFGVRSGGTSKIRRLSLQSDQENRVPVPEAIILTQVRSLATFGACIDGVFSRLKFIRVLVVDRCRMTLDDMVGVCLLLQLRYLKIAFDMLDDEFDLVVPPEILNLRSLETLDITDVQDATLTERIADLSSLRHLLLPLEVVLPDDIGRMKSLRTIRKFDMSKNSVACINGLGELTNLRDLQVRFDDTWNSDQKKVALCSALQKLAGENLKHLAIISEDVCGDQCLPMCHQLNYLHSLTGNLETLRLEDRMPTIPNWIGQLGNLYDINLAGIERLNPQAIDILAKLPALLYLKMYILIFIAETIVIRGGSGSGTAFPALKYFDLICSPPWVSFEQGAMPKLQRLEIEFDADRWEEHGRAPAGIHNLGVLQVLSVQLMFSGAESDKEAAKSALRAAIHGHPRDPRVDISQRNFSGPFSIHTEEQYNMEFI